MNLEPLAHALDRLLHQRSINLLLPFAPGGIIVFSLPLLRPEISVLLEKSPRFFGPAPHGVLALLAAYVIGASMVTAVNAVSRVLAHIIGYTLGRYLPPRQNKLASPEEASKLKTWRQMAAVFVGPSLSPPMQSALPDEDFQARLQTFRNDPGGQDRRRELWDQQLAGRQADSAWRAWFVALELYFREPLVPDDFDHSILMQSSGWAAVIVLGITSAGNTLLWALSLGAAIGGFLLSVAVAVTLIPTVRSSPYEQMASMLRELQSSSRSESEERR